MVVGGFLKVLDPRLKRLPLLESGLLSAAAVVDEGVVGFVGSLSMLVKVDGLCCCFIEFPIVNAAANAPELG